MSDARDLRRAAIARARASGSRDPRVAEVLERAVLHVREREGATWESSDGTVIALDVRAIVDGYALGTCDAFPSVRDAVVAAITAEAPLVLGASVVDIDVAWGLRERPLETLYRGDTQDEADPASSVDVRRALIGYLEGSGDHAGTPAGVGLELEISGRAIAVRGEKLDVPRIERALSALLGRRIRVSR